MNGPRWHWNRWAIGAVLVFLCGLTTCTEPRKAGETSDRTCTSCHGDSARMGDALTRAAPPFDLWGNTEERFMGVGAHQRHLNGSTLFPSVKCEQCHPVPNDTLSPGHNDGHTQVTVPSLDGGLAYRHTAETCANSACHINASGAWTQPRSSEQACGSCHGAPPPAPHPQSGACSSCHGELSAKTHLDGTVTLASESCTACHGSGNAPAPPRSLDGGTSPSQRGVGAHQAHLNGGRVSRAVSCETCHTLPTDGIKRHPNGGAVELKLQVGFSMSDATCVNACHSNTPIEWTRQGPLECGSCHANPPAFPHPQMNACTVCHPSVSAENREHHVNGVADVSVPANCDSCHGSTTNPAPPRGLDGGTSSTQAGVGAHQAHLVGRGLARRVLCNECHVVPKATRDGQHLNGRTDVVFSGVAVNGALVPSHAAGTCTNTACHNLAGYTSGPTGGTNPSPNWVTDGGTMTCTSCHGLPPPSPHVNRSDCESCHRVEPELHINGHLDLQ